MLGPHIPVYSRLVFPTGTQAQLSVSLFIVFQTSNYFRIAIDLRHEESERKLTPVRWRWGLKLHAWLARQPRLYHALTALGIGGLHLLGRRRGRFARLPLAAGWTSQRDFPAPSGKTFMQQYGALQRQAAAASRGKRSTRRPDPRRPGQHRKAGAGSRSGAHPGGPRGKKPRRRPERER